MKTIIDFLKNWTLPSAIVSGTVIYLIFYWVRALDPVSEVMEPIFDTILPLFMSLILFTTFLRYPTTPSQRRGILSPPRGTMWTAPRGICFPSITAMRPPCFAAF